MKICLGTVQFGLNYGIEKKKIEISEIDKILTMALENGISVLDTAQNYGDSEKIIGKFKKSSNFKIISKISSTSLNDTNNLEQLKRVLKNSLDNLRIPFLDGLLLHKPEDLKNTDFLNNLNILKEEGYFTNLGVSIYSPDEANLALEIENLKYIQIPYNILDTRLDKIEFFERAKKKNKIIFARSVFLQGVLLKEQSKYPNFLEELKIFDNFLEDEIRKLNCSKLSFLLNFVKKNKKIDYIIVGIESLENLEEIIEAYNDTKLQDYNYSRLRDKFTNIPEKILNPSLWNEK